MDLSLCFAELEILDILWNWGEGTVRDVYEEVRNTRIVTLPAIMLSMERLTKRGVLEKMAGPRAAVYKPAVTREGVSTSIMSDVIDRVLLGSATPVMSHLVGKMNKEELEEIAALIEEIRES